MSKVNTDKIRKELSKANIVELYQAFNEIKDYVSERLKEAQKEAEETASEIQSKIDRINNN